MDAAGWGEEEDGELDEEVDDEGLKSGPYLKRVAVEMAENAAGMAAEQVRKVAGQADEKAIQHTHTSPLCVAHWLSILPVGGSVGNLF